MPSSFVQTVTSQTMNLDVTKMLGIKRDVTALCTDLFLIIIRMREAEDLGDPAALRKLITYYLSLFEKNCKAIGMDPESAAEAKYAIVALVDETVLSVPGACRDYWISRPCSSTTPATTLRAGILREAAETAAHGRKQETRPRSVFPVSGARVRGQVQDVQSRGAHRDHGRPGPQIRRTRIRVSSDLSPTAGARNPPPKRGRRHFSSAVAFGCRRGGGRDCLLGRLLFCQQLCGDALLSSIQSLAAR